MRHRRERNNRERVVALEVLVRDLTERLAALEHDRDDDVAQWVTYFGLEEAPS